MAQLDLLMPPAPPQFIPLPVPIEPSLPPKSDDAYRTISEVADVIGVPQHVLRFWESNFPQLKPSRMRGARRYYRPEDVALLKTIKSLLYDKGYTIKGAKQVVRGGNDTEAAQSPRENPSPAKPVPFKPALDKTSLISELRVLKSMLTSLL